MRMKGLALLLAIVATGCASNRHCLDEQEYQRARTLQAPAAVEGLAVPESPSALLIPAAPENAQGFAYEEADPEEPGETRLVCLDLPPRMPPEKDEAPVQP